jgi:hypothetical protein
MCLAPALLSKKDTTHYYLKQMHYGDPVTCKVIPLGLRLVSASFA